MTPVPSISNAGDSSLEELPTPLEIANRPGLSAISYRAGTHAAFRQTMLSRLAASEGLHIHEESDFTVGLVDAFASMAEVLTFYQERIANQSYLRTATERRSLLELARLIDYSPRPGVAASVHLAFTLEDAQGAPEHAAQTIMIPRGLRVQSMPGPGQQPQVFQTFDEIEARPEWNALRPLRRQPQPVSAAMLGASLSGAAAEVAPGDSLLIVADTREVKRVLKVTRDLAQAVTRIDLAADPPDPPPFIFPIFRTGVFATGRILFKGSAVAEHVLFRQWHHHDLQAFVRVQRWPLRDLTVNLARQAAHRPLPPEHGVFAFRQKAAIFGHNAPKYLSLPADQRKNDGVYPQNWEGRSLADEAFGRQLDLDRVYPGIVIGSWVVLESQTQRKICRVEEVFEHSRSDFTLSGKVTRLRLDSDEGFASLTLRGTGVFVQSEKLELAELPIVEPVEGASVTLDGASFGLKTGQTVILTGTRADLEGVVDSEALTIADITFAAGFTTLAFQRALQNNYIRDSVTINANVTLATHGETVREILGGGDASRPFQSVSLRQQPLTHISSDGPSGAESTLELRVNDLPWQEVPRFFGHGPNDRVFLARTSDEGQVSVAFGDGRAGARPATGSENIVAVYRKGGGSAGNIGAGRITLLPERPIGVRGVTNPLPASGATNPEPEDEIRRNASLTMLTFDRIVSLLDYENFARAFAGVAKAFATWTWSGQTRGVFVTVAGAGGAELSGTSRTSVNLLAAMRRAGDPHVSLRVQSYRQAYFRLSASVIVDASANREIVLAAVESKLRTAYAFEARLFGQPVALSEIMATIQSVPGVRAVNIDQLFRTGDTAGTGPARLLVAAAPQVGAEGMPLAAELLVLDPRPIEMTGASA